MATGEITLGSPPEDSGSDSFPPGNFKDPKRLYCKNGGFFLRIRPDGGVDGVREKKDPHIKLRLQATSGRRGGDQRSLFKQISGNAWRWPPIWSETSNRGMLLLGATREQQL
ncbi:Fibroblast growth factor 2 [Oryzias melastigma]|uniref:Fibroblast growth factor 2 n=1 Tax=Oryzias melastigma TaxID=30732 RepID=A0A834C8T3_ORYME|nr:Fibroblast growth factor 2 [Oryzias melastigma]